MKRRKPVSKRSSPLLSALGRVVASRRRSRGITQVSLADEVGVIRSYLSDVERGLRNLTLNTLDNLATALGTTAGKLLRAAEKSNE